MTHLPPVDSLLAATRAIQLMDLTSLNEEDDDARIIALCQQARTPFGNTAAVCIYPRFVGLARLTLATQGTPHIKVATVVNFPHGDDELGPCWPRPAPPSRMAPTRSIWCSPGVH